MNHGIGDHSMHTMNHSMMNHSAMDHSLMDHSMMDHSSHGGMTHSGVEHAGMDHAGMDHGGMDHAGMDHGGMDHTRMDHGGMDHGGMDHEGMDHGMMHSMTFHFWVNGTEKVLFNGWEVRSINTLLISVVGIFFMAVIYEGIKYFREHLLWETYHSLQYRAVDENGLTEEVPPKQPRMFSRRHCLQTALHVVQLTISYLLMLIFMTYNVWLCMAVVAGSAAGYFLFGWKRTVVVDMTETCH